MIYMLDTNTLIVMIRGRKPDAKPRRRAEQARRVVDRCRTARQRGDTLGLSAITVAELEYGARLSGQYVEERAAVRKVITPFILYPFDAVQCPWHYGKICRELEEAGQMIEELDLLIAAHALSLHATVVTNHREHFRRVSGLRVVDWT